jgi:hypothetical protein
MASNAQASGREYRVERWIAAAALLLFPLLMMRVGREWTLGPVAIAEAVIAAVLVLVELVTRRAGEPAYRSGVTLAVAAALLQTWINLVAEIPSVTVGAFVLVLGAGVGAFAVRGRADGMARVMLGVAAVQAILTALTATDPSTAGLPGGVARVVLVGGYFTALWLTSAALFQRSARARN